MGTMKDPRTLKEVRSLLARATTALSRAKVSDRTPGKFYRQLASVPGLQFPMPHEPSESLPSTVRAEKVLQTIRDATVYEERAAAAGWGQVDPRVSFDLRRKTYADSEATTQGDFFARTTDPDTSHERMALEDDAPPAKHMVPIARAFMDNGAGTYRDAAEWTGIKGTTTSTVMTRMRRRGLLERTGETKAGAHVHKATSLAADLVAKNYG